jgi:probable phosphoglycerate mutase
MARAAGKACQHVHFDVCYCSPLIRARETAELVLKDRDIPIIYDERLMEMSFGVYEGLANSFQIPDCPINVLFKKPEQYEAVEGGESFAELFARTGAFLEACVYPALAENKDVLIIGHGAMNSSIVCQVKQIPLERFWEAGIENCKLMRLL